MRTSKKIYPKNLVQFQNKLLAWSQQYQEVVWLNSNNHNNKYSTYKAVLAVGAYTTLTTNYHNAFKQLQDYQSHTKDWLFGYLTYDLKNDVEQLNSKNFDGLAFPDLCFFQPKKLFLFKNNYVEIKYLKAFKTEIETDLSSICNYNESDSESNQSTLNPIKIKLRTQKDDYFKKVKQMLAHIKRGNIYEANFCQEFYAENATINPLETFNKLNAISKPPFAAFLKLEDKYLLSTSPERYLKKKEQTVISQPIKGTAKRSKNKTKDNALKTELQQNQKERSENIMIVDLVRNDLSKTAKKGSVKVAELCKVYSFLQVHQMQSTISSKVPKRTNAVKVLKTTFPMGSMTGAPKVSAMQIIEDLEDVKRGLYSGAVGYFSPKGNFDFNVVIRSILYNSSKQYISYSVGSAITAKSSPLKEYEECLIKAKAMREVLEKPLLISPKGRN